MITSLRIALAHEQRQWNKRYYDYRTEYLMGVMRGIKIARSVVETVFVEVQRDKERRKVRHV